MKLTLCLSGHLYITKAGKGVHLSPQDIKDFHDFIHREEKKKEPDYGAIADLQVGVDSRRSKC